MDAMDQPEWKRLYDCCRTCLNEDSIEMYGIFEHNKESVDICKLLSTYTSIQVLMEDQLPKRVCSECYNCLLSFHNFTTVALQVDIKLKECIRQSQIILNRKEDDKYLYQEESISSEKSPKTDISENIESNNYDDIENNDLNSSKEISGAVEDDLDNILHYEKLKKDMNLEQNMLSHSKEYNCVLCTETFTDHSKYVQHLLKHNNLNLDKGQANQNSNQTLVCEICSLSFKSIPSLSGHKKKHTAKDRVLQCTVCGKLFKKISHLKRHELKHIDNRLFKCTLCPKSYASEDNLKAHLNKHNGIKAHCCPICMKGFSHLRLLTNHIKIHTGDKPYLCPTCGKVFESSTNLNQHMKRHAGVKSFACNLCPKKFVTKGELKSHGLSHSGERSFTCEQCNKAYPKRSSLEKHKLTHLGFKPYQCDVCTTKFSDKSHLKRHFRIHTGEKPYRCDICDRAYTQSNDLLKHKRSHLGNNLYKCDECSLSFRLKMELRKHISVHFISAQMVPEESINTEQSQFIQENINRSSIIEYC